MKRAVSLLMVVLTVVLFFSSCSLLKKFGLGNNSVVEMKREYLGSDGLVDLKDYRNYYISVDGNRYDMNTTVHEVINDGYTVSSDIDLKEVIQSKNIKGTLNYYNNNKMVFTGNPINRTNKSVKITECSLYLFHVHASTPSKITTVCGLTIGSTRQEVENAFGVDYYSKTDDISTYKPTKESERAFSFIFDEYDKVKLFSIFGDVARTG